MPRLSVVLSPLALLTACGGAGLGSTNPDELDGEMIPISSTGGTYCDPAMSVFPVADAHNIGYDAASCGTGTCEITCPDENANSDWGGDHHGIDVFAYQRAPLVAVADGVIKATGEVSDTSGLRIRLEDACGWQYYYGHMDEIVVSVGQTVHAGDLVGYMGYTGTSSTHLHFNISPWGDYYNDIDPIDYLKWTSATACDGTPETSSGGETTTDGGGETTTTTESGGGTTTTTDGGGDAGTETTTTATCGWMEGDGVLYGDEAFYSCDGRFALVMQTDGNLVLYEVGTLNALWNAGTQGNSGAAMVMQTDGNLVVYNAWGTAIWDSHTSGYAGAGLAMQDDGNLVIYWDGWVLWNSGTSGH